MSIMAEHREKLRVSEVPSLNCRLIWVNQITELHYIKCKVKRVRVILLTLDKTRVNYIYLSMLPLLTLALTFY